MSQVSRCLEVGTIHSAKLHQGVARTTSRHLGHPVGAWLFFGMGTKNSFSFFPFLDQLLSTPRGGHLSGEVMRVTFVCLNVPKLTQCTMNKLDGSKLGARSK